MTADRPIAPVRIHALGGFRLVVEGRELRLRTRKEAMLLLELALASPRRIRREESTARLWPDSSEARARHSLSEALRGIEQATPIRVDRAADSLAIPEGQVWTDVGELESAIARGEVDVASRLYVGGFLAGWYPPTAETSHWVDRTSARIASSLETMARAQVEARRRSTDSRGVTTAVELLERLGVATEADREAAAEAAQITGWESLRPGEAVDTRLPVDREGPFVGRTEEMRILTDELERALAGELRVVLVAGEPGIGKTRTCQRLARLAALRGARLLMSSCYELEQSVAFGAISEAFAGAVTASDVAALKPAAQQVLGEVLPEVREFVETGRTWEGETQQAALSAFSALFDQLGKERTPFLFLDDIQWADATSCQIVHYLLRSSAPRRGALIVLAYRPDDIRANASAEVLLKTPATARAARLALSPMSDADIRGQLEGALRPGEAIDLTEIIALAEGNPFFARELALAGADQRDRHERSLDHVVLSRVRTLPFDESALLSVLAVAGAPMPVLTLSKAAQQPVSGVIANLASLSRRRLVKEVGAAVAVSHDLTRHAIYNDIGEPARQSIHATLAEVLTGDAPDSYLAFHYSKAGMRAKARLHALRAASESREKRAFEEELEWLLLALSNAEESDRTEDLKRTIDRMFALARYADAVALLRRNSRQLDPALRCHLSLAELKRTSAASRDELPTLLGACDALFAQAVRLSLGMVAIESLREKRRLVQGVGEHSLVLETADALEVFGNSWPEPSEAAYARAIAILIMTAYHPEAVRERLIELKKQAPELPAKVRLTLGIIDAMDDYNRGHLRMAGVKFHGLLRRARSEGNLEDEVRIRTFLVVIKTETARFRAADRHAQFILKYAGFADAFWEKTATMGNLAASRLERSDYVGATQLAEALLEAECRRPMWMLRAYGVAVLGACALELGRMAEAARHAAHLESFLPPVEQWATDLSVVAVFLARHRARRGDTEGASKLLESVASHTRSKHRVCFWTVSIELTRFLPPSPERTKRLAEIRAEAARNSSRLIVAKADYLLAD